MWICKRCETQNTDRFSKCPVCGRKNEEISVLIKEADAAEKTINAFTDETDQQTENNGGLIVTADNSLAAKKDKKPKKEKKKKFSILKTIMIILIIYIIIHFL